VESEDSATEAEPMKTDFIGSTVAMVMGGLSILTDFRDWPNMNDDRIFGGLTAILGAAAYRSAKQRRLGLKPDTGRRQLVEIALLILVFVPTIFAVTIPSGVVLNPWSSVIIPAWSLIAYLIVRFTRIRPTGMSLSNTKPPLVNKNAPSGN
jgi:hypothetical protein